MTTAAKKQPKSFRKGQIWHVEGLDAEIIDTVGEGAAHFITWLPITGPVHRRVPAIASSREFLKLATFVRGRR